MKIPSDESRLALLRALLRDPRAVVAEQLDAAKRHGIIGAGDELPGLLRVNDRAFFAALDAIPGVRRRDLSVGFWDRVIVPLLRGMQAAREEHEL